MNKVKVSDDHYGFVLRHRQGRAISECASGSSRFVIHPSGKITRCFGRNDPIANLYDVNIDFIEDLQKRPLCQEVTCIKSCDTDWTDKLSTQMDSIISYPQNVQWVGGLSTSSQPNPLIPPFSLSLFQVNVVPTLFCNYSCPYCVAGSHLVNKKHAAGIQIRAQTLIDFLEKVNARFSPSEGFVVFISGGESFLWTGLIQFCDWAAKKNNVSVKINTRLCGL
jgi:sulfatase maturation enzyme AslB (radical SAM superfamily)